jgi:hypothetical protein
MNEITREGTKEWWTKYARDYILPVLGTLDPNRDVDINYVHLVNACLLRSGFSMKQDCGFLFDICHKHPDQFEYPFSVFWDENIDSLCFLYFLKKHTPLKEQQNAMPHLGKRKGCCISMYCFQKDNEWDVIVESLKDDDSFMKFKMRGEHDRFPKVSKGSSEIS